MQFHRVPTGIEWTAGIANHQVIIPHLIQPQTLEVIVLCDGSSKGCAVCLNSFFQLQLSLTWLARQTV